MYFVLRRERGRRRQREREVVEEETAKRTREAKEPKGLKKVSAVLIANHANGEITRKTEALPVNACTCARALCTYSVRRTWLTSLVSNVGEQGTVLGSPSMYKVQYAQRERYSSRAGRYLC